MSLRFATRLASKLTTERTPANSLRAFQKKYTTFKCKMQVVYLKMKAYAANQPV